MKEEITQEKYDYISLLAYNKFKEYKRYTINFKDDFNLIEPLITFEVFKKHGYNKLNLKII